MRSQDRVTAFFLSVVKRVVLSLLLFTVPTFVFNNPRICLLELAVQKRPSPIRFFAR